MWWPTSGTLNQPQLKSPLPALSETVTLSKVCVTLEMSLMRLTSSGPDTLVLPDLGELDLRRIIPSDLVVVAKVEFSLYFVKLLKL